jgi:hypothetical protein
MIAALGALPPASVSIIKVYFIAMNVANKHVIMIAE